jgi:hypothetical protein
MPQPGEHARERGKKQARSFPVSNVRGMHLGFEHASERIHQQMPLCNPELE